LSKNWTNQQRYADTKTYLATVDANLPQHVEATLPITTDAAGALLSLQGNKMYAMFGNSTVGRAVRALKLCHLAYLGLNWARQTGAPAGVPADRNSPNGGQLTADTYLNKTEAVVRDAIKAYLALHPHRSAVADAAELVGNGSGAISPPFEKLTRAQNPFPSGQVCFNCVYWWLFKSGFVSLRWILHKGMALGAENANTFLGDGVALDRDEDGGVPDIERGMVINWRGTQPDTKNICHWAVSLGDGFAIGANNSLAGRLADGQDVDVHFRDGMHGALRTLHFPDSQFGIFSIDDMWKLYAGQKTFSDSARTTGCIVAVIDPANIPHRDTGA